MCYGVVIVCGDFYILGVYIIWCKVKWFVWILIVVMIKCEFYKYKQYVGGMNGGLDNLLGLCVFYFYCGNCDIYLCIYGMLMFWFIGLRVSFGCVCMVMVYINYFYENVDFGVWVYFYLFDLIVMVCSQVEIYSLKKKLLI